METPVVEFMDISGELIHDFVAVGIPLVHRA
jgi:hypothetical protein